jgi:hypothetical protein
MVAPAGWVVGHVGKWLSCKEGYMWKGMEDVTKRSQELLQEIAEASRFVNY